MWDIFYSCITSPVELILTYDVKVGNNNPMKKRIIAVSLLSVVLILSSCQKIKDLLTVKVKTDFTVNLPVTISSPLLKSTEAAFLSTNTLDPLSNADLASYKDKISGYAITGLSGTISELSADVTLTDAKLKVNTDSNSTEWNFTNVHRRGGRAGVLSRRAIHLLQFGRRRLPSAAPARPTSLLTCWLHSLPRSVPKYYNFRKSFSANF